MTHILLFGASGGIGGGVLLEILDRYPSVTLIVPHRSTSDIPSVPLGPHQTLVPIPWDPDQPDRLAADLAPHAEARFDLCLCAIGGLHHNGMMPEKKLGHITMEQLTWAYQTNAIVPSMIIKHVAPLMAKTIPSILGIFSARVGSIGDNRLGGWYAYRAAKAALNMMIKTAAIEMKRFNPNVSIVGIHPGTVDTPLSEPFQTHVPKENLFTPRQSASYIFDNIINQVSPSDSGHVFAWDGERIPE